MKAMTYMNRIRESGHCSIHDAEMLTKALHREGLLAENQAIRFRTLFGDFDIVNADFKENGFDQTLCEDPMTIELLIERFE